MDNNYKHNPEDFEQLELELELVEPEKIEPLSYPELEIRLDEVLQKIRQRNIQRKSK